MSALEIEPGRNGHRTQPGRTPIDLVPTLASVAAGSQDPAAHSDTSDVFDFSTICAEEVHVPERLIAAPRSGVFQAAPPEVVTAEGEIVHAGQVVGSIQLTDGTVSVTSNHTGFLMGLLAMPGERVRADQPLAWVRVVA
jgi:biotin carboxyl carrier protein